MSVGLQAFLLGLLGAYCWLDWCIGFLYCNRPIVLCPLAGLILNDFQTGLLIGAVLETYFLGSVVIGAYVAPDAGISGILACAFAIKSGLDADAALVMAVPIAVVMTQLQNILWTLYSVMAKIADKHAENGNDKGVYRIIVIQMIGNTLLKFFVVYFAWLLGADKVNAFMDMIPPVILNGMAKAGGVLPAIGMAILMIMIMNKENVPYYILGFFLAAYLKIPIIGIAVLGLILVFTKYNFVGAFKTVGKERKSDDNEY